MSNEELGRKLMLDIVSMLVQKGHTREQLLHYVREDIVNEVFNIPNDKNKITDLKQILEIFDEKREHYGKAEMEALIDKIAKVVWNKK